MRSLNLFLLCLLLLVGCSKPAKPASTPAAPPPAKTEVAGDGFFLDVPKWHPTDDAVLKGLAASYKWGSGETRTTKASDGGTVWRLTFPDRPRPADVARIELRYEFGLTKADDAVLTKVIQAVTDKAIEIVADAATGDGEIGDLVAKRSSELVVAARPLEAYTAADGTPGNAVVLKALGFRKRDDGSWELVDTKPILSAAGRMPSNDESGIADLVGVAKARLPAAPAPASDCSKATEDAKTDESKFAPARLACAKALEASLTARAAAAQKAHDALALASRPKSPEETELTLATELLTKARALVTAAVAKPLDMPDKTVPEAVGAIEKKDPKGAGATYELRAFVFAHNLAELARARASNAKARATISQDLKGRIVVLQRDELGSVIVAGGGERRIYDISTGVVYLVGLDDTITPVLIAACPIGGGCLSKGEHFYDSGTNVGRSFSFDFGVRAQTLDKPDPRAKDALAFLLGASWNPIYFARLSAGTYNFENAQTGRWNWGIYGGLTVNVLQAVELLGVVGLGSPAAPKIVGY